MTHWYENIFWGLILAAVVVAASRWLHPATFPQQTYTLLVALIIVFGFLSIIIKKNEKRG